MLAAASTMEAHTRSFLGIPSYISLICRYRENAELMLLCHHIGTSNRESEKLQELVGN